MTNAQSALGPWGVASGTGDAIRVTYDPALSDLQDGQICSFRAHAANTTIAPIFAPNELRRRIITRFGGAPLAVGDIAGPGHEVVVRYNAITKRWELLNPAKSPLVGENSATRITDWLSLRSVAPQAFPSSRPIEQIN
jgi:hypothetical protein